MKSKTALALAIATLAYGSLAARAEILGPAPYLSFADSPFQSLAGVRLETFEDGLLNTPGMTVSGTWFAASPGPQTDSVDGDDGVIDGAGLQGRSLYSNGTESSVTFTFDAAAFGGSLPTHAGIVWTDVGLVTSGTVGFGGVTFSAIDGSGASIGSTGPVLLGDGSANGETADDRFFGVTHAAGIRSITLTMSNSTDWEVDHLQAGVVPEPGSVALLGLGGLLLGWRLAGGRRRR